MKFQLVLVLILKIYFTAASKANEEHEDIITTTTAPSITLVDNSLALLCIILLLLLVVLVLIVLLFFSISRHNYHFCGQRTSLRRHNVNQRSLEQVKTPSPSYFPSFRDSRPLETIVTNEDEQTYGAIIDFYHGESTTPRSPRQNSILEEIQLKPTTPRSPCQNSILEEKHLKPTPPKTPPKKDVFEELYSKPKPKSIEDDSVFDGSSYHQK